MITATMSRNSAVAAMTAMKKIEFQGTQTLQKRNTLAREGQTKNKEAEGLPGCPAGVGQLPKNFVQIVDT